MKFNNIGSNKYSHIILLLLISSMFSSMSYAQNRKYIGAELGYHSNYYTLKGSSNFKTSETIDWGGFGLQVGSSFYKKFFKIESGFYIITFSNATSYKDEIRLLGIINHQHLQIPIRFKLRLPLLNSGIHYSIFAGYSLSFPLTDYSGMNPVSKILNDDLTINYETNFNTKLIYSMIDSGAELDLTFLRSFQTYLRLTYSSGIDKIFNTNITVYSNSETNSSVITFKGNNLQLNLGVRYEF